MIAVQVKSGSEEFKTVERNLKATAQNSVNSVVKVRIFILFGCKFKLLVYNLA